MRKIRLSDTDVEFFDMEVSPTEFLFFTKHKDAFRCMWKDQGKPFWTRFIITFRSYTVKQGVIKQMSFDSPKLNDLLDQGFINVHEQFLEGNATTAKSFVEDIARLAQNHDKFPNLDSKNFAKDPFYCRETRELFRQFFGSPDQKASYLKVYILSPVYLRFGGSVCRCLKRWMEAVPIDINDDSYWIPPASDSDIIKKGSSVIMCSSCLDECGTLYFQEKLCGKNDGPKFIESWTKGDPRFNDKKNPLYNKIADPNTDWRSSLTVEDFRDFVFYTNNTYGDKCDDCLSLTNHCHVHNCPSDACNTDSSEKKKRKRKKKKKDKEKESETTKNVDEIEKLVNHIEGKAPLKVMPENTIGGAKSPTKDDPAEQKPVTPKKTAIFTKKAKISDDFKYGIMPYQDKAGADLKRSVIGGFKVKKIEDEKTGACEITVTITTIKAESGKDRSLRIPGLEKNEDPLKINRFPLTADLLRTKMIDLPKKMEWFEGWNWCASVMNFEEEERELCAKPTNFTIKVTGKDEECVKRTMFKLLFYVIQRKSRPCAGWNMEDDDVMACILPDESSEYEGISICIIRGFRFEERLTDEEKSTMQAPPEECIAKPKKVMMTWQPSKARSILTASPVKGRAELKELLLNVGSIVNRVDEIPEDCSPQKRRQLELKIKKQMTVLKARPPRKIDEGPMYKQMKQNPDTFELFIMSEMDKVEELEAIGMMAVDVDVPVDENSPGNVCENCCQPAISCLCVDKGSRKRSLPECNCANCLKELCAGALAGDFDHILAKDGIVKENEKYVAKTPQQIEADIQTEHRQIQSVLGSAEKRLQIKRATDMADNRIITKNVARSVPTPKVIKIDKSTSVEKTIEEIKQQTSIYKLDAKRTVMNKKKGRRELVEKDEKDSDLEHELRQQRIKELERERIALRKMVLEEKLKEENEKQAAKETEKKEIEPEKAVKAISNDNNGKEAKTKKKNQTVQTEVKKSSEEFALNDKQKELIERITRENLTIRLEKQLKGSEEPLRSTFEFNEKFVKENPQLLKKIIEVLENAETSLMTDDAKAEGIKSAKIENKIFKPTDYMEKENDMQLCSHNCCNHDDISHDEDDEDKLSVLKETEKTFNIIKKIGTKRPKIEKRLQEIADGIENDEMSLEEFNGMAADILLTGEPSCPCQVKAREMMREKLRNKQKLKESSVSGPDEKTLLAPPRPAGLPNDPTIDISDLIEEQLIDSFNIKRIVKLDKVIAMNATTQTPADLEGVKPHGFKEKVITSKPWTNERRKCVKEKDQDFEKYLKFIGYKQDPCINIGIQTENDSTDKDTSKSLIEKNKKDQETNISQSRRQSSPENEDLLSRLRKCANCNKPEDAPKTYMKCQKCKTEGITNARYYCGRDCQVKDWGLRHKKEHKEKLII